MIARSASGSRWASSMRAIEQVGDEFAFLWGHWSSPSSHDDGSHVSQRPWRWNDRRRKFHAVRSARKMQENGGAIRPYANTTARAASTAGKIVAGKIRVFLLAQRSERIEPLQLGVDEARVAHDHAVRQPPRKREQRREIWLGVEIIGAGKARIGAQPERGSAAAEPDAQDVRAGAPCGRRTARSAQPRVRIGAARSGAAPWRPRAARR